jgi:hypothetical protein
VVRNAEAEPNETALLETKRKPEGNFFHRRLADSFIPNQDRLRTALGYSGRLRVAAGFLLNLSGSLNVFVWLWYRQGRQSVRFAREQQPLPQRQQLLVRRLGPLQ